MKSFMQLQKHMEQSHTNRKPEEMTEQNQETEETEDTEETEEARENEENRTMKELYYGAAYYDEYMPEERLEKDIRMMQDAGMNLVRIAESTWATYEPRPGEFDFSHVVRVLNAMEKAGMHVIVGTPTYAVPYWLTAMDPTVLADTHEGRRPYGSRQIMDITNPTYRKYGERIIRRLMEVVEPYRCVVGFQLDNETKYYDTLGPNVQKQFVEYLKKEFHGDLDALNAEFGLNYWSNRIGSWDDFPDVRGTINGSLAAEFDKFRRGLVDEFLQWQRKIVDEYRRPEQFVTHNLDFDWRGCSYGVQSQVNHFHAARALTIAGCDIYHPSQDHLTGAEAAFGGDLTRSLLGKNYLLLETEAQGFPQWTPYPGQLRLQAYSHLASGANSVEYWHWHSLHNALETYWKGVLSHDLAPNAVYREASVVGNEWKKIGSRLVNLRKKNRIAMLISNESLTALNYFPISVTSSGQSGKIGYNDVVRWMYDVLYRMNLECDFLPVEAAQETLNGYAMILVPALYAAPDSILERLNHYVEQGGTMIATFKSGFTDEYVKVAHDAQPHILCQSLGVTYQEFAFPENVGLTGPLTDAAGGSGKEMAELFMELLIPQGAEVLASYVHPAWGGTAAVTENRYGSGRAIYLGCRTSDRLLEELFRKAAEESSLTVPALHFPVIVRKGTNDFGREITYVMNFSGKSREVPAPVRGRSLLKEAPVRSGEALCLAPWGLEIIESDPTEGKD